ncbi:lysophospholipase catalytic domain-containing protein [Peziza echinospora]|nr:lysophospholipase catalytic domain-containing protein [Peziza echinospora]
MMRISYLGLILLPLTGLLAIALELNIPDPYHIEGIINGEKAINHFPSYAPKIDTLCPAPEFSANGTAANIANSTSQNEYIRPAYTGLNHDEAGYIANRASLCSTRKSLSAFARAANLSTEQTQAILGDERLRPNTAVAFSGGGYRAMLNGAAMFRAMDARDPWPDNSNQGGLSGLLQGMNYMVGLSGGNWLVGASALNNFMTVAELRDERWELEKGLITGMKGDPIDHAGSFLRFMDEIKEQVEQKEDAGFDTTLTDFWSLALGRQLVNRTAGGPEVLWSGITEMDAFKNNSMPFPISIADARRPGENIVERNSTIFESTPYEFGSWDSAMPMFFPMEILGTNMSAGKPIGGNHSCVRGFDVGAFIMGTSSSIFSGILAKLGQRVKVTDCNDPPGDLSKDVQVALFDLMNDTFFGNEDIANYPNPFRDYTLPQNITHPYNNAAKNENSLYLADGGLDNQNIPFWPLLQSPRHIDFILSVDSSADTPQHWPNGSSLITTQKRTKTLYEIAKNNTLKQEWVVPFPYVPDSGEKWISQGLNHRPVFFGCNGRNYTDYIKSGNLKSTQNQTQNFNKPGPLILYLPNVPWSYYTNSSTFQLDYIPDEVTGFLDNGARQALQSPVLPTSLTGNASTIIPPESLQWRTCIGCALFQRSKERAGIEIGETCKACFEKYCWGGGYSEDGAGYNQYGNKPGAGNGTETPNSNVRDGVYDPVRKDGSGLSYEAQHKVIQAKREEMGVGSHIDDIFES